MKNHSKNWCRQNNIIICVCSFCVKHTHSGWEVGTKSLCVWPENAKRSIWSVFLFWLANHATTKINTYSYSTNGWLAVCLPTSPIHQFIFQRSGSQSLASIITEIKISWQGDKSFVVAEIICVRFVRFEWDEVFEYAHDNGNGSARG